MNGELSGLRVSRGEAFPASGRFSECLPLAAAMARVHSEPWHLLVWVSESPR